MRNIITAVMLLAFVGGCGANSRTKALRVGLVSLNAARDTVIAVSKEREAQIVERATSKEDGQAQLDAWRSRVDAAMGAIDMAQNAIFSAALLSDAKSAGEAGAAVSKALALVKELRK